MPAQLEPTDPARGADQPAAPALAAPRRDVVAPVLVGILLLLVAYALVWARELLLPILIAGIANLVLRPVVKLLRRAGIPAALGAALVVGTAIGSIGYAAVQLADPAAEWMERVPTSARQIERRLRFLRRPIEKVSEATVEVEKATRLPGSEDADTVVVKPPSLLEAVVSQARSAVLGGVVALILLYLLLARPNRLLEKLVEAAPRLRDKKRVVLIARRLEDEVSRYLLTISAINAALGVAVGLVLYALAVPNAPLWGVLAMLANFVPYAGAAAMTLVLAGVGVLSFDAPGAMFAPAAAFLVLTSCEAYLVTPVILGRRHTLSPVAVFVSVLVWSWLWGIPGALVAVPLLAAAKIVGEQIEATRPLARLLD